MSTPYHAKYWANALTIDGLQGSVASLSRSFQNARVDLNPHQVDAALFALRSPLSRGVILADEVGLGKTIEAGIVLTQKWAERKRRILLIVPATLRKQWQAELEEKFAIPSLIFDARQVKIASQKGHLNPLDRQGMVILCSYPFAASHAEEIRRISWDLVVIDEAHRLRNVYKAGNKQANAIREATLNAPKLLLTATPLQNSLLELYGLVSFVDAYAFGDLASFREQFVRADNERIRNNNLRERLQPFCTRTLRRQVLEYVRFTQRIPITQGFYPSDDEHRLYGLVSSWLQREVLAALPASQRSLMTLILRKLLASSTFAIAGTLRKLVDRLEVLDIEGAVLDEEDYDPLEETEEEWGEDLQTPRLDPAFVRAELSDLRLFEELARSISINSKGSALLTVLPTALEKSVSLGAAEKAVIFTESRRTQQYLFALLSDAGYRDQIVMISGGAADARSRAVYQAWKARHAGTSVISGIRDADMKAALVEEFRDRAKILIATESAAEGVNLQFCSLVVNYDLPWNPQRVEQRIGRCHRYGQKHDVVVVNFLNERNAADQRVFELLSLKFRLFDGVFGASDEVLGALESGVDLEKRIVQVYQECRTEQDIRLAFDQLQEELDEEIKTRMLETRKVLLDHFDEEVHARLRFHYDETQAHLDERQRWLLALSQYELNGEVQFFDGKPRFQYTGRLAESGNYNLDWRDAERLGDTFYRPDHPLADTIICTALGRELPVGQLQIRYSEHPVHIADLETLVGQSGWVRCNRLRVESKTTDEFLLLAGITDAGCPLSEDVCRKLLSIRAESAAPDHPAPVEALDSVLQAVLSERLAEVNHRNTRYFEEEAIKLDHWAEDLKLGLESELKELERAIREAKAVARSAIALEEKLEAQKQVRALEAKRNEKRRRLYDAQDDINRQRDELIEDMERQLQATYQVEPVFVVRWTIT